MSKRVWWLTSDYFGRSPQQLPTYYLRLGVRETWLLDRDRELWEEFVAELERRSTAPDALARETHRRDNGRIPPGS